MHDPSFRRGPGASKPKPWYERDRGARLEHERAIVNACQPGLQFKIDEATRLASLEGMITIVEAECRIITPVQTRIDFHRDHPATEPIAYETGGRFQRGLERHLLSDGYCCLWLHPESRWDPEDPNALRVFLDELALFFDRQLIYDVTLKWPGPAWGHGAKGYLEFAREQLSNDEVAVTLFLACLRRPLDRNAECPCGSGRKYKRCHLGCHDTLARRIGPKGRALLLDPKLARPA